MDSFMLIFKGLQEYDFHNHFAWSVNEADNGAKVSLPYRAVASDYSLTPHLYPNLGGFED